MNKVTLRLSSPVLRMQQIAPILALLGFTVLFAVLIHTALRGILIGSDFYTFWLAGKAMLVEHLNPYSDAVTLQSQIGIYGRAALLHEDQVAFAYPPYSLLMLLPVVRLSFDWAYAVWLSVNIVGWLTILFSASFKATRMLSLSSLLLFPLFFCLVMGNFSVLIAAIILLFFAVFAIRQSHSLPAHIAAGVLLAWATAKPQFVWLFIAFILLFAVRAKLFPFLIAFFASLAAYIGISFLYVPGWAFEWLGRIQQYAGYVKSRPTITEFFLPLMNEPTALVITYIALLVFLGLTARFIWLWWKGQMHWMLPLAWIGLTTFLFHPHGLSYEQMTFLIPLILWTGMQKRWKSWPVLVFWFGSIFISWLAFSAGVDRGIMNRLPVVFNAIWVAWLFLSKRDCLQV